MIFERNRKNPTKRNGNYDAKDFYWLQPKREFFEQGIIGRQA
jgi:hypothetical protein